MDYNNSHQNRDYFPDKPYIQTQPAPVKKRHMGAKIVALVLAVLVLAGAGGVGGVLLLDQITDSVAQLQVSASSSAGTAAGEDGAAVAASGTASTGVNLELKTFSEASSSMTPSEIYEAYVGSVVAISSETVYTNYFGQTTTYPSTGTGFILTADGYILTNNHVVEDASTVQVTLFSGDTYDATIIGADEGNDIAVLKIDATGLTPVNLGDSDEIIVGEDVAVIGNPLGELTNSLSTGVVSATDRMTNIDGTPINMFQIDAAVNPGNSGGPVFDATGRVIGVVAAKYSDTGIEGLGFAIPINDAINVAQSLISYGYVTGRPALNIIVKDVDSTTAAYYSFPLGSMVMEITEGGAGDQAGLQVGDIIVALDGQEITGNDDLSAAKLQYSAYDTATLTVYRSGEYIDLSITFDEAASSSTQVPTTPEVQNEFPYRS